MAFSSRAVSAPSRGGQQFAASRNPAARLLLPAVARSRRGRSPLVLARAAIEAPRPSSPQPPQSRNSSPNVAAEISMSAVVGITSPSELAEEEERKSKRESVLCTRLAGAHSKAVTALLVLNDRDDVKEIVTASLDKTVALWRLAEGGQAGGDSEAPACDAAEASTSTSTSPLCSSAAALVARLSAACGDDRAPVFALAADVDGAADAARLERILANSSSSSSAGDAAAAAVKKRAEAAAAMGLSGDAPPPAAASSSSTSSASPLLPRLPTVFIGGGTPSVRGWQPGGSGGSAAASPMPPQSVPDVVLEGHSGWVRSLAASGRWLFSCGCGGIKQWDLSRAVPRCVATVSLPKGDVSALAATATALYAGGADGSLCAWRLPTSRKNEGGVGALKKDAPPDAVVPGAHSARVSALAVVAPSGGNGSGGSSQVCSASHDGSIALWSLCLPAKESGSGGKEEPVAAECCVTFAEEEAAAAAAEAAEKEKVKAAKSAAKLVLVSRVSEAHGVVAADEATATAAAATAVVAVAPASDASIPAPASSSPAAAVANKVHAVVVARDGLLYTGGDDGLVARWVISSPPAAAAAPKDNDEDDASSSSPSPSSSSLLAPAPSGPLHGHGGSPVRALAAGPGDALVSGDAAGNVLLWRL